MITVAAEKEKLRSAAASTAKPRGPLKKCPIQPCPSEISEKAITCDYHWRFSSRPDRDNRVAEPSSGDHWLWVWNSVQALVQLASRLEEAGVYAPWEYERKLAFTSGLHGEALTAALRAVNEKSGHTGLGGCPCDWCAPLTRWAIHVLGVAEESWAKARVRYGR